MIDLWNFNSAAHIFYLLTGNSDKQIIKLTFAYLSLLYLKCHASVTCIYHFNNKDWKRHTNTAKSLSCHSCILPLKRPCRGGGGVPCRPSEF